MQVLELMKQRCSVRRFQAKAIEHEKLEYVLEAGRVAPSACNNQPWSFVVVQNKALMGAIAPEWVASSEAPALIVACGNHTQAWRRRDGKGHLDVDVAIAVDHMTLAAAEQGLGSCWICSFDAFQVANRLELPPGVEPVVLLPLGYPAEKKSAERHADERKSFEEIVTWI